MFLLAAALLIGLALGVFGGGGSLLTVALLVHENLDAQTAIGTSLAVVAVAGLAAMIPHARAGHVIWNSGLLFGAASVPAAYAGARAAAFIPGAWLLMLLAAVMTVSALRMLRAAAEIAPANGARSAGTHTPAALPKVVTLGALTGALTGLVGAGGGFLVVPALSLLGGLSLHQTIGTSLLVIVMTSVAGLLGHAAHVTIDYTLALWVGAFASAGTLLGYGLAQRLSPRHLRTGFAWFILLIAGWLVYRQWPLLQALHGVR